MTKNCAHCGSSFRASTCMKMCSLRCRVLSRIDSSGGDDACWPWRGGKHSSGYAHINDGRKLLRVTRLMHEWFTGPISSAELACHSCDNPECCNPKHIWAGTPANNMHDRDAKMRGPRGSKNGSAKLNEASAASMREMLRSGATLRPPAKAHGVARSTAFRVAHGTHWKHVQ